MKYETGERILKVGILVTVIGLVVTGKSLFCDRRPETALESNWSYIHTTSPIIEPSDTTLAWDSTVPVIDANVESESGDTAHIVVAVNPGTEEVVVTGDINGSPIVHADIEVIIPEIERPQEERGDFAVVVDQPLNTDRSTALGLSWERLHWNQGKARIGLTGVIELDNPDHVYVGIRGAYRWRNLSVGGSITRKIADAPDTRVGINAGFYL